MSMSREDWLRRTGGQDSAAMKWTQKNAQRPTPYNSRPRTTHPVDTDLGGGGFAGSLSRKERNAIKNFPGPDDGSGPSGSGPSGGGYAAPPPLVLPRMQLPAPELLAQQAFMAVDAARSPYTAALSALAQSRTQGEQAITMADREAATAGRQIQGDWQRRTAGIEGNIAGIYRQALDGLASVIAANNQSMMNAGFQPAAAGQNEALSRMAGLGASAREAALVRRQLGADMARDQGAAVAGITQAGRGALSSTYAQVLGSLQAQQAAAEAAARFEQFNREMALRQEIDRINYDASVQEAVANR